MKISHFWVPMSKSAKHSDKSTLELKSKEPNTEFLFGPLWLTKDLLLHQWKEVWLSKSELLKLQLKAEVQLKLEVRLRLEV
jgi:hypothetical protein